MNAALTMRHPAASDKLPVAALFSTIVYLAILFGISFDATSPPTNKSPVNLDIILVTQQTDKAPEESDFLAQANNDGGSDNKIKKKPTQPASVPQPIQPLAAPVPQPVIKPESPKPLKALTRDIAERKIEVTEKTKNRAKRKIRITPKPVLSVKDLVLADRREIRQLDRVAEDTSTAPKRLIVSSRAKRYAAAAYLEAWQKKNEKIGNLHYPIEAKRKGIYGGVTLSVDINADGSVPPDGITIKRSSGYKVLDNAAINIIRLASPYAPIPEDVLKDHDMMTITRVWRFGKGGMTTK